MYYDVEYREEDPFYEVYLLQTGRKNVISRSLQNLLHIITPKTPMVCLSISPCMLQSNAVQK